MIILCQYSVIFFLLFIILHLYLFFFFFNDPPTPEIYPLSLHDALPISCGSSSPCCTRTLAQPTITACSTRPSPPRSPPPLNLRPPSTARSCRDRRSRGRWHRTGEPVRSEEHTSELQSRSDLVCRLLLQK